MQKKSQLGAFVAVALAIPALFIFVMIHHGRSASRTVPAQSVGLAASKAAPAAFDWTNYGKLPLAFEANQGQTASDVRFLSRGDGYTLFLTGQEAVLTLRQPTPGSDARLNHEKLGKMHHDWRGAEKVSVLRMRLDRASPNAAITGVDRMPTKVNYFVGNDPKKWHADVPVFSQVKYQDVYPGVDLLFYGNQRRLEYDFQVAPGADANAIALDVKGASKLQIDRHGNLLMKVAGTEVVLQKPVVYQEVNGERREIAGNYAIANNNHEVRFAVSNYDRTQPLTIDPVLNYVTYLGGSGTLGDQAFGIALDAAGDAYVAGITSSTDFPTQNPESSTAPGDTAALGTAFVSELNPMGTALIYSTYLGGSGNGLPLTSGGIGDGAAAIAVDTATPVPNIYVTGFTGSSDFPVSTNALIGTAPGGTSTGGSGFVTKLIPGNTGSAQLGYSSYLGGDTEDQGDGIAVDTNGNAYVAGVTLSTNFPTTTNAISTALLNPNGSGFLTVINPTATTGLSSELYSTYFGGTNGTGAGGSLFGDAAFGVTIDTSLNVYIVGTTTSSDFPTKGTTVSPCTNDSNGTAFVYVIDTNVATPTVPYATCLGAMTSNTITQGQAIALGPSNVAYVTGQTTSSDFPVTAKTIPPPGPGVNVGAGVVFVSLLNTTGATPNKYSTFLGGTNGDFGVGVAADTLGNAYVTGLTNSANFPITQGALIETDTNANGTGFVAKINPGGNGLADLLYSSYFGGNGSGGIDDIGNGIAVSTIFNAYITGMAGSSNLPVSATAFQKTLNSAVSNAFVAGLPLVAIGAISFSPTSLTFGGQLLTTTSMGQNLVISNTSTISALNISAITASKDFNIASNSCGNAPITIAPAGTPCTLSITFAPSGSTTPGADPGTIMVTDNANGSPQSVALTGTAWDFSVSAPSSVSVAKGAMGTFPVTITGLGGFTGAVSFTCTPGSTLVTSCAVPTTNAAAAPGATATATLTASSFVVAPQSMKLPPAATMREVFLVMLVISLLFMIPSTSRFRARMGMLGAVMVFIVVAGCNGGGGPKPKTSTVVITPSSGGVTKPAITVTVNIT